MHSIDDFTYYTIEDSSSEKHEKETTEEENRSGWIDDFGLI